jgi:uncharacterized membrane protein
MRAFIAFALFVTTLGCDKHAEPEGDPSDAVCPSAAAPTYASFGRAFMTSYCTRCHSSTLAGAARSGAPAGHDFDSRLGVIAVAEHVDEYAAAGPTVTNETMPPSDPRPTVEERRQLGAWLACELAFIADGGVPDGI